MLFLSHYRYSNLKFFTSLFKSFKIEDDNISTFRKLSVDAH